MSRMSAAVAKRVYVETRPLVCSAGHLQARPFGRHIAILLGAA
jgi:hypothetical protein